MTAVTIDSSVFLSPLVENDPRRNETLFFLSAIAGKEISVVIPSLVVAEVLNVLIRNAIFQPEIILGSFLKYTIVNLDENFIHLGLDYWRQISLKASDAIIALTSAIYNTVLVSWDEKLVAEAGKITKAITPAEFMRLDN